MTISVACLEERKKSEFKVVLVPQCPSDSDLTEADTKFTTIFHPHPITQKNTEFVVTQHDNTERPTLSILDRINWKNPNVKNQSYTPDGKPYRCLFITRDTKNCTGESSLVPATVLGSDPDIHVLTPFSPIYFLLNYFNPLMRKSVQNGKSGDNDQRMLSYEDLLDEICERDQFLGKLVQTFSFDLKPYLEIICESTSIPSTDSDDEESSVFYKPSIEKMRRFLTEKFDGLTARLMEKDSFKTIKIRWETMYPGEIPSEIKLLMCKKQSLILLANYVDEWYINQSIQCDFSKLEQFIQKLKEKENAENLINESLEQLHEGTAAVLAAQKNKKSKTVKKPLKQVRTASVAVGKGTLDMFFRKKE